MDDIGVVDIIRQGQPSYQHVNCDQTASRPSYGFVFAPATNQHSEHRFLSRFDACCCQPHCSLILPLMNQFIAVFGGNI
jgi:hypothetical protein